MADKVIKSIAEKQQNGEFGDAIPIGADAENVKLKSGQNLEAAVGEIKNSVETNKNSMEQQIADRAPNNHASSNETYGVATDSKFGHVKISGDVESLGADAEKTALSLRKARDINQLATEAESNARTARQELGRLGQLKADRSHTHQTSEIVGLDSKINSALDANTILAKIKTVDGVNSGLDAALVRGVDLSPITDNFNTFKQQYSVEAIGKANRTIQEDSGFYKNHDTVIQNVTQQVLRNLNEISIIKRGVTGIQQGTNAKLLTANDVSVNLLRDKVESNMETVTGYTSSREEWIICKLPLSIVNDQVRDIHISGKVSFFHEAGVDSQTDNPLNQPLEIDFSVMFRDKENIKGGHFVCEHKVYRPIVKVAPLSVAQGYIQVWISFKSGASDVISRIAGKKTYSRFELLSYSPSKVKIKDQTLQGNTTRYVPTFGHIKPSSLNRAYDLEDCSVFPASVDGKKKIADAINGKTSRTSASANMSFDELKGEIDGLWIDKEERMTTDGTPFNFSSMNMKTFIQNNRNKMVKYPHIFDTKNMTDMYDMFYNCVNLTTVPLFNTQNVTRMNYMFQNCFNLTTVPLFNTQNTVNMGYMFQSCSKLTTVPLFNTQNATTMEYMFQGCSTLPTVPLFNTSKVTTMQNMFGSCSNLTAVPLFNTQKVAIMMDMFNSCAKLTTVPLFNTENVTNMEGMFNGCSSLTTVPSFNTGRVTNMKGMFYGCSKLKTVPSINAYNTTTMENMFVGCHSLQEVPYISTSRVENISGMFSQCSNLTFVPKFDTSRVTNWDNIFAGCISLDIYRMRETGWEDKFLQSAPTYINGADYI